MKNNSSPDYFYTPPDHVSPSSIIIDGEEFAHLVHVMRKKQGDEIRIVDGRGTAYDAIIEQVKKKMATCTIQAIYRDHHEPARDVAIAVGILKNPSKFDFLVEKASELGVRDIIPLRTARTIPSHAKSGRWQKLALAAMKQSGRSYLPIVHDVIAFEEMLERSRSYDLKLIAHEKEVDLFTSKISRIEKEPRRSIALVGPEGGFSDDEVTAALNAGFKTVYLGERRLRTETAAIVMSYLLLSQNGRE